MIYLFDQIGSVSDECLSFAYDLMYSGRRQKTDRYHFKKDRTLSTLAYALLLYALKKEGMLGSVFPVFIPNSFGKPYLPSEYFGNLYFNLSHCDRGILCGLSEHEIGVDMEGYVEDYSRISDLVLHPNEKKILEKCPFPLKLFTQLWTIKEAFTKLKGCGLSMEITELDFSDYMKHKEYEGNLLFTEQKESYVYSVFTQHVSENDIVYVSSVELSECIRLLHSFRQGCL